MNVACTSCPAKYAVPDDKVRGKRVRITCKHCSTALIIDGTALNGAEPSAEPSGLDAPTSVRTVERAPVQAVPPASKRPPGDGPWIVALGGDRQESASIPRLVELYGQGIIKPDTFLWREGMSEWKTPFEIPQIEAALRARSFFPESSPPPPDEEATQIVPAPSENKRERSLPRLREDDDGVTVARDSQRPPGGRVQLEPPRSYSSPPSARNGAEPLSARGAAPGSRPRATTSLGLGPAAGSRSAAPARRPSVTPPAEPEEVDDLAVTRGVSSRPPPFEHPQRLSAPASQPRDSVRAARRSHGRAANGEDLFAERALDGSEEDVTLGMQAAPPPIGPRMTGARNESSVLFSLDALSRKEPERRRAPAHNPADLMLAPPPSPMQPGSAAMGPFMSSLAAPDFTAPSRSERPPPVMPAVVAPARPQAVYQQQPTTFDPDDLVYPRPKRRWGLIGTAALLVGGVAVAFALGIPQKYMAHTPPPGAPAEAPAAPTTQKAPPPTPAAAPAPEPEPAAETAQAAAAPAAAQAPAEAPQQAFRTAARTPSSETKSGSRSTERSSRESEEEDDDAPATIEIRNPSLTEAMAESSKRAESAKPADEESAKSEAAEAPESSGGGAFDRGAAVAALGSAATSAQTCKMLGGPTGSGQAMVTFAPSGRVTSASVSGDFAGSTVGGCVARLFRNARVPAFSGDPVTVKKSFSIE